MKALELRKRADKSGPQPAEGEPWPFDRMELVSEELPEEWEFIPDRVEDGLACGYIEYGGDPLSYEVYPDPLGTFKHMSANTITLPGDRLVLHLWRGDEALTVTYRIVTGPVPRGFRCDDASDLGFRVNPTFQVELEEGA